MPAEIPRHPQLLVCDFEGCNLTFRNRDDLNRHKVSGDSEHEYCTVCRKGFKDWSTFVKHKIRSPDHISCPVCAADFNSHSGKERHINLSHQKSQRLVCLGCNKVFARASALIAHMEEGRCTDISQEAFKTNLYRKEVLNDILKDPNRGSEPAYASSEAGESEHGGVILMDQADPVGENKAKSLESLMPIMNTASINHPGTTVSTTSSNKGRGPKPTPSIDSTIGSYGHRANSNIEECAEIHSLNSTLSYTTLSENNNITSTKNKGKEKATEMFPTLPTSSTTNIPEPNTLWASTRTTATRLFSDASKTPVSQQPTTNTASAFAARLQQINNDYSQTYGHAKFSIASPPVVPEEPVNLVTIGTKLWDPSWDPDSERYTPEKFFNQTIQMYECPHKHCSFTTTSPVLLTSHLHSTLHSVRVRHCPSCLRTFKSVTALIAHCESASTRCKIRDTDNYDRVLGQISGGFLAVEASGEDEEGKEGEADREVGTGSLGNRTQYAASLRGGWARPGLGIVDVDAGRSNTQGTRSRSESSAKAEGEQGKGKAKATEKEWEKGMVSYKAVRPAGI